LGSFSSIFISIISPSFIVGFSVSVGVSDFSIIFSSILSIFSSILGSSGFSSFSFSLFTFVSLSCSF
jgi:hypothetical protein